MRTEVELEVFAEQFLLTVTSEAIRKCERAQRIGLERLKPLTMKQRLEARAMVLCMMITAMSDCGVLSREQVQSSLNLVFRRVVDRTWKGWTPGLEEDLMDAISAYARAFDGGEERFDFEELDFEFARRAGVTDILVWSRVSSVVGSYYVALVESLRGFKVVGVGTESHTRR